MTNYRLEMLPTRNFVTHDCRDLHLILQVVNEDKTFNFCNADASAVANYITENLSSISKSKQPEACEIQRWWYDGYDANLGPFCVNATRIAVQVNESQRPDAARTEPYFSVIHASRSSCGQQLESDLTSIGYPDIAGPGVSLKIGLISPITKSEMSRFSLRIV